MKKTQNIAAIIFLILISIDISAFEFPFAARTFDMCANLDCKTSNGIHVEYSNLGGQNVESVHIPSVTAGKSMTVTLKSGGGCTLRPFIVFLNDTVIYVGNPQHYGSSFTLPEKPGKYFIYTDYGLPIEKQSIVFYIILDPVGLNNIKNFSNDIIIYPNPASDVINVISNKSPIKEIRVFDTNGREILTFANLNNEVYTVPISDYPKGIYIIQIATLSNRSILRKIYKP